jgi:hypothetical protein
MIQHAADDPEHKIEIGGQLTKLLVVRSIEKFLEDWNVSE